MSGKRSAIKNTRMMLFSDKSPELSPFRPLLFNGNSPAWGDRWGARPQREAVRRRSGIIPAIAPHRAGKDRRLHGRRTLQLRDRLAKRHFSSPPEAAPACPFENVVKRHAIAAACKLRYWPCRGDRFVMTPRSRHQFVAARFSEQNGRSGGILLDLLP
jgi:hypothetical protein